MCGNIVLVFVLLFVFGVISVFKDSFIGYIIWFVIISIIIDVLFKMEFNDWALLFYYVSIIGGF